VKYILTAVAFFVLLIAGLWIIAVPEKTIVALIETRLAGPAMQIECTGFKKGLFPGFSAERVSLKKDDHLLIAVDNFNGRVSLLSLLKLELPFSFTAGIGDGILSGRLELLSRGQDVSVSFSSVSIRSIPFFEVLGLKGDGLITGGMALNRGKGDITFDLKELALSSGTFGNLTIPLTDFRTGQGALGMEEGSVKVKSFTMEGPGIYGRVKGEAKGGRLDLNLEIMPEKSYSETNPLFRFLEQYRVSPGYYRVPLTNRLNF